MAKTKKPTIETGIDEKKLPASYIRQPYPVSAIQANLSTQQIRILVAMMQSVQDGVREMFERNHHTPDGQLLLFPDIVDRVDIDFKFRDVVDRADSYSDVEKVAEKFMKMVFRYEIVRPSDNALIIEAETTQLFVSRSGEFEPANPDFYADWKERWNVGGAHAN